jgi:hypothetical protein
MTLPFSDASISHGNGEFLSWVPRHVKVNNLTPVMQQDDETV